MPTVNIKLQQGLLTLIGVSSDQFVLTTPIVLSIDNPGMATLSGMLWSFADKPEGSTATLATPTTALSGFTPDQVGTYLIHLNVNVNGVAQSLQVGAAINTTYLQFRIPATTESDEFDNGNLPAHGWGPAVKEALKVLDDGYGGLLSYAVTGSGAVGQVAFWDGVKSITGNAHLTYDNTYFTVGESPHHITSIFYGDVGVLANVDTFGPSVMVLGGTNATGVDIGHAGIDTVVDGYLKTNNLTVDGYRIKLSGGAVGGQTLMYNNTAFVPASMAVDQFLSAFTPTLSHSPAIVEVGATIVNPAFTANYNRSATAASLDDGSGVPYPISLTLPATSFAFGSGPLPAKNYTKTTVNDTQTWTLSANEQIAQFDGPIKSSTVTVTWAPYVYYGSNIEFIPSNPGLLLDGDFEGSISPWNPAINSGGTATAVSELALPLSIITNGDFETGDTSGWTIASTGTNPGVVTVISSNPHSGTYCVEIGGPNEFGTSGQNSAGETSIAQNITLPSGTIQLSFWYRAHVGESVDTYDWFKGQLRDSTGSTFLIDLFAGEAGFHSGSGGLDTRFYPSIIGSPPVDTVWKKVAVDVSAYAGQTVQVFFAAHDDNYSADPSYLIIDDVSFATTFGANGQPYAGSLFGLVTADGSLNSQGLFVQPVTLPSNGTITFDGYYRSSGSGVTGNQGGQIIAVFDDQLMFPLVSILQENVNTSPGSWQYFTEDLSGLAGQTVNIVIAAVTDGLDGPRQLSVDSFSIIANADPTTYLSALTGNLQTDAAIENTTTISLNEYFVVVLPTSYGAEYADFIDAETGLPIGMVQTSSGFVITNTYGINIPYDFWRSEFKSLGQILFKVRA